MADIKYKSDGMEIVGNIQAAGFLKSDGTNAIPSKTSDLTNDSLVSSSHLSDIVSHATRVSRDISVTGTQVISGLPFTPKAILAIATVSGVANKNSIGVYGQSGAQYSRGYTSDGNAWLSGSTVIYIFNDINNYSSGIISVQDHQITITWGITVGAGATGTVQVDLLMFGHGSV